MNVFRTKTAKALLLVLVSVIVLAAGIPVVGAFEAHSINVTVHVKEECKPHKRIRLCDYDDIWEAEHNGGVCFPGTPNPPDVDDPEDVPTETCVAWMVELTFTNANDYPMTNVVIDDCFPAEFNGQPLNWKLVETKIRDHTRGEFWEGDSDDGRERRIKWYPTFVSGDVSAPSSIDNSGCIQPGETETLRCWVWTAVNPLQCMEYYHPGCYCFNPGADIDWDNDDDHDGGWRYHSKGDRRDCRAHHR